MSSYVFFPSSGKPYRNIARYGQTKHSKSILIGPDAPRYVEFDIEEYDFTQPDGSVKKYLISYEQRPSDADIEAAIVSSKLPPFETDDEDE